jgi:hypothetical protein
LAQALFFGGCMIGQLSYSFSRSSFWLVIINYLLAGFVISQKWIDHSYCFPFWSRGTIHIHMIHEKKTDIRSYCNENVGARLEDKLISLGVRTQVYKTVISQKSCLFGPGLVW